MTEDIKQCHSAINILESEDGLGLADSVGVMIYGSTEEYHIM